MARAALLNPKLKEAAGKENIWKTRPRHLEQKPKQNTG